MNFANDTLLRCYAVTPRKQDANKTFFSKIKSLLLATEGS
jgi:hypothetical protein